MLSAPEAPPGLSGGPDGLTVIAIVPVLVGGTLATAAPVLDATPVERNAQEVAEREGDRYAFIASPLFAQLQD